MDKKKLAKVFEEIKGTGEFFIALKRPFSYLWITPVGEDYVAYLEEDCYTTNLGTVVKWSSSSEDGKVQSVTILTDKLHEFEVGRSK